MTTICAYFFGFGESMNEMIEFLWCCDFFFSLMNVQDLGPREWKQKQLIDRTKVYSVEEGKTRGNEVPEEWACPAPKSSAGRPQTSEAAAELFADGHVQ